MTIPTITPASPHELDPPLGTFPAPTVPLRRDIPAGALIVETPENPQIGDTVRVLGVGAPAQPAPAEPAAPQAPSAVRTEPAAPVETAAPAETKHRARTGAGARFNPDHVGIYMAVNWGVVIVTVAAVLVSWQGLTAVAAWMLIPPVFAWIVPVMLDVTIVVFTIGVLPRKARGESTWLLALGAYLLTAISAAANFAHVVLESPAGTPELQRYAGASLAALAPMLILLTTEVLGLLITKPNKQQKAHAARLQAARERAELAAVTETPKPRTPRKPARKTAPKNGAQK
ncbi:hypothetical protein BKA24_001753 [Microbacterium marinum]|uniref:Uncharacterized protein n=1 Tax=Microbacterium marinum TaxID=421115 RepID=A0A7W7FL50_9MICO|nr:DUF2637 domain-containing protein [Microbacterium marinum]MBB4667044.1 hypothetical protein [Microbacterium marinum]